MKLKKNFFSVDIINIVFPTIYDFSKISKLKEKVFIFQYDISNSL